MGGQFNNKIAECKSDINNYLTHQELLLGLIQK